MPNTVLYVHVFKSEIRLQIVCRVVNKTIRLWAAFVFGHYNVMCAKHEKSFVYLCFTFL